jgi:Pyruvate/2-oxoacid:ferredoxin oxidoreductase gamma subunit
VHEGREVLVFGIYGGHMRGGNTDSTVVIGDGPLQTPPVVDEAWAALAMHNYSWHEVRSRLRPGGVALVDTSVFRGAIDLPGCQIIEIRATEVATQRGDARAASMIALGAFAAATGIVGLPALTAAAAEVLPSYRAQFAKANIAALEVGFGLIAAPAASLWGRPAVEAA